MAQEVLDTSGIAVWYGPDVGNQKHHACALAADGRRLFDKPLPKGRRKIP